MDFLFRSADNKRTPSPTSYPPRSLSTVTYFSRRGDFSSMVPTPRPNTFPMPMNNANEALWRELEKDQIRREIIAGGLARRRELEEEVRRELALERGWGTEHGFSFDERMSMRMRLNPFDNNVYGVPQPQLPQLMPASEFKPSPETNKDKVIKLAKPDRALFEAKRKAVAPPGVDGSEDFPFGLMKKPKEEWSCALCHVSATSERGFNEHLQGKKHRAKETALRNQKIGKSSTNTSLPLKKSEKSVKCNEAMVTSISGLDAKADVPSLIQPAITTMAEKGAVESKNEEQLVQKNQNIKGLKDENGTISEQEAGRINALKRKMMMMKFWCEICEVGTGSETVMESHKKGRKHLARMKKLSENYESAPPTSSVSLEAPGLIKETDAVKKETDQKVTTQVMKKEAIIKMINIFDDSDDSD